MRINRAVATTVASVLALGGLAACSNDAATSAGGATTTPATSTSAAEPSVSPSGTDSPSESPTDTPPPAPSGVLKVGMPNQQQTENFNPFLGSSAGASLGFRYMMYEPLVMMNAIAPADPGAPWLAEKTEWAPDFKQVAFTVREGATWTDGKPVTAEDVAFTFQLMKDNEGINGNALKFDTIKAEGNVATVTFPTSQFVNQTKIVSTLIVPKHIWEGVGDPEKYENKKPVGSGPYELTSFTPQTITLDIRKDGKYWQPLPAVAKLLYTSYADNNAITTALANDEVEWGFTFIAGVQKVYIDKNPEHHKLWFPPNLGAHGLWFNTTKKPWDDKNLRKAVNLVINRQDIFEIGEEGYFYAPITNITGIPTPAGEPFIADEFKDQNLTEPDVEGAKQLLADAGYKLEGGKLSTPDGKPVTLEMTDPAGWSDYQTDLEIIKENIAEIGIEGKIIKENQDKWFRDFDTGNFESGLHWTNGGATPYDLYENIMNGDLVKPIGKTGVLGNYGRFKNEQATEALKTYATAADETARNEALVTIQKVFVEEMPVALVMAANVGAQYNTMKWVGWPDEKNPYAAPQPTVPNSLQVVLKLRPAAS